MTYSSTLLRDIKLSTFETSKVSDLDFERLDGILKQTSFAIIRGLIEPKVIRDGVARILAHHDPDNDHAATGESPADIMDNFQKVSIGGAEHSGVYRPRCMRTFYNPIWADDIYGMRGAFVQTAKVRNRLYKFHEDFAISSEEGGFWTASRVHNYPRGGGFLVSHTDNIVPSVQSKAKLSNEYFQPVIVMSKKGGPRLIFMTRADFLRWKESVFSTKKIANWAT